jgi:hypothetical protein
MIDIKFNTKSHNILACRDLGASNFWQGVMWAARAAKLGYRWKVKNGVKIKFWKDMWFRSTSLAIQYWELYVIVNEQNATIANLWDGTSLRCTFRRCVDRRLYDMWLELCSLVESVTLSDEEDELIWQYQSS